MQKLRLSVFDPQRVGVLDMLTRHFSRTKTATYSQEGANLYFTNLSLEALSFKVNYVIGMKRIGDVYITDSVKAGNWKLKRQGRLIGWAKITEVD